jgi:hypothetical protein
MVMSRKDNFLAGHGMTPAEQHGAEMRASAVPASDFEGVYESPGSYTSPGARLLQQKAWESRMRKEMGDGSDYVI